MQLWSLALDNFLFSFIEGMELYPRFGKNFDIKVFTNCRFVMMSWAVLAVTYCIKQAEQGFYFIRHEYYGLLKEKFQQLIGKENPCQQVAEVVMERKLQVLKDGLQAIHVPYAYGFAIILLTVIVKVTTLPLTNKQEKMQLETARLYKQAGVNPLAACYTFFQKYECLKLLGKFYNYRRELRNKDTVSNYQYVATNNGPSVRVKYIRLLEDKLF